MSFHHATIKRWQRLGASGAVESGAWLDDESPFGVEELGQSSVGEIVALLVEWSPGEGIGSSFGLQGTLMTYAKENAGTALEVLSGAVEQGRGSESD